MMRLHAYPQNIDDPNSKFLILLLLRLTYGDVMASCILELVMKEILAPMCLSELAREILINHRYIDDMVAGSEDEDKLLAALKDLQNVLASHDFSFKVVFTNSLKIKDYLNEGDNYTEQTPATYFHHTWIPQDDTLSYPLSINVFPKRRGLPTGPDLPNTNIQELTITKRLGSCVLGQLWILSGAFAGPIMASAKILFSLLCTFLTDWTTPLKDDELRN